MARQRSGISENSEENGGRKKSEKMAKIKQRK